MIATSGITLLTFFALTCSIIFFPFLKLGKIHTYTYWIVALAGALILLVCRQVPVREIWANLTKDTAINPLKILVLFFSMTFLSVMLDEVGFFRFLAKKAVKFANNNQRILFIVLYFLVAVLTVFTSNDIMILTLTPFICFFCKNTDIDPLPYLVSEFAAANTWSMMLIIGNPTNIYLATSANIDFLDYFKVMVLPTFAAGSIELLLILLIFHRKLRIKMRPHDDFFQIKSLPDLIIGILHLTVCLVFLVISEYVHIPMWTVAACCALSLLICTTVIRLIRQDGWSYLTHSLKRLPWQLIPFVLSMFVVVISLNYQGISKTLGDFLGDKAVVWTYGGASFLSANLINNIPMSILFSSLSSSLPKAEYLQAIYVSIIGSNIGAFLTPIGALAGIMFTDLTEKYQVNYGFKQFIKYGVLIAFPTIVAALLVLELIL